MKDDVFKELLVSLEGADAIMQGKAKPARMFEYPDTEVCAPHPKKEK